MTDFAKLDDFDRAILNVVQRDSSLTHEAIGAQVSLSASSVRRRLAALREGGFILREVALLDGGESGVTLIVSLTLTEETPEAYEALDAVLANEAAVKQTYHIAGSDDYILIVNAPILFGKSPIPPINHFWKSWIPLNKRGVHTVVNCR